MHNFIFVDGMDSADIRAALSTDIGNVEYSDHGKNTKLFKIGAETRRSRKYTNEEMQQMFGGA